MWFIFKEACIEPCDVYTSTWLIWTCRDKARLHVCYVAFVIFHVRVFIIHINQIRKKKKWKNKNGLSQNESCLLFGFLSIVICFYDSFKLSPIFTAFMLTILIAHTTLTSQFTVSDQPARPPAPHLKHISHWAFPSNNPVLNLITQQDISIHFVRIRSSMIALHFLKHFRLEITFIAYM